MKCLSLLSNNNLLLLVIWYLHQPFTMAWRNNADSLNADVRFWCSGRLPPAGIWVPKWWFTWTPACPDLYLEKGDDSSLWLMSIEHGIAVAITREDEKGWYAAEDNSFSGEIGPFSSSDALINHIEKNKLFGTWGSPGVWYHKNRPKLSRNRDNIPIEHMHLKEAFRSPSKASQTQFSSNKIP